VQAAAAGALKNLALDDRNRKAIAAIPQALQRLVALLRNSNEAVQESASGALLNLAVHD
jgi:chemotaxis regulatin CheY-phosphate phosphatase CheZ